MLIFFHLFLALTVGCVLAVLLKNKRAILYCGLGGVLPDIIDKPLGAIFLEGSINLGRIYCHTILIAALIFLAGVLLWKQKRWAALTAVSVGWFLHQLGDFMWNAIQIWAWPFLGPFPPDLEMYAAIPDWAEVLLDVAGWMVAVGTAIAVLYLIWHFCSARIQNILDTHGKQIAGGILAAVLGVGIIAGMRYLIMDFFLGSVSADFFKTMFLHELISFSEWVFGMISLGIIMLVLLFAGQMSEKAETKVYTILGVVSLAAGFLMPVCWLFGIPLDEVYGFPTCWVSVIGLVVGGVLLLVTRKRVAELGRENLHT